MWSMKACKALKSSMWEVHFTSKFKFYTDPTKHLVILAMCLFFVVPFIYAWMLARNKQRNKQNKKTQDMQYISNLYKTSVRYENMIFNSDNN